MDARINLMRHAASKAPHGLLFLHGNIHSFAEVVPRVLREKIKGMLARLNSSYFRLTMESRGCAIGPDGNLLDASQIPWFRDPDDVEPMPPVSRSTTIQGWQL